jgi:hypothetical protein
MNNIDVWIVNHKHIINMYMKLNNEKKEMDPELL